MNRFRKLKLHCVVPYVFLSGCAGITTAPTDTINDVTKAFGDVVSASATALAAEETAKPAVRRDEAVMYWMVQGDNPTNLTSAALPRSFSNYVCAGSGALRKAQSFVTYAQSYATSVRGITTPGGDTFAAQWKKFKDNEKSPVSDLKPLEPKNTSPEIFKTCADGVVRVVGFYGTPATDTSDEVAIGVSAVWEAFVALSKALETAAKDGLKAINEIESRKKFSEFVTAQHQRFGAALGQNLSPEVLDAAWERRKARALWKPYGTFLEMMNLKPTVGADRSKIVALASRLNLEMVEYDTLQTIGAPGNIVKKLATAESRLYEVATDDKVSLSTVVAFLQALSADATQLTNDYATAKSKAAAAQAALGKL